MLRISGTDMIFIIVYYTNVRMNYEEHTLVLITAFVEMGILMCKIYITYLKAVTCTVLHGNTGMVKQYYMVIQWQ